MTTSEPTAWVDGRVFTGHRRVEAILVDAGRVVVAGTSAEVRRHRPTGTATRSLAGGALIPGLVDSHCHIRTSVLVQNGVDLSACPGPEAIVERLRAATGVGSGPILGWGWDETHFSEGRYPTRADLDQISIDRPIVAFRRCLHVAAANSAALDAAGLAENARDPKGGSLGRNGARLDGLLYDAAVSRLDSLQARRFDELGKELGEWLHVAAARGLTTLVAMSATVEELRRIEEAHRSRHLPLRIRAYVRADQLPQIDGSGDLRTSEDLRVTGVKTFADGALGARTAWLSEPYSDAPHTRGESRAEPAELTQIIRATADRRLAIAVHAIGDNAIRQTLRAFRTEPPFGVPRIEHASVTPPELLTELAAVRPAVVVQPSFVSSDGWIPERLGAERARWAYAFRSLIALGLHVAGSSDSPVEVLDPWVGMTAATAPREGPSELERLTPSAAFSLYTREAGVALGEPEIGTLHPGAYADMVLLDAEDWLTALRQGIPGIAATFRAGEPTYVRDAPR